MSESIEAYARMMAELASAGDDRAAVLARYGLTEATWAVLDDRWQEDLSSALDPEDDGVPEVVSRYAAAYEAAQRSLAPPITLEQFAQVTRLLSASGDVQASLAKVGITMADYVRGTEHWTRRLAGDEDLERRFHEVVRHGVET